MLPLSSVQQGIIRFGDFEVDLRSGELRKHGIRIKLQIQPFQVLQALLEHPGEVIDREQLQKRIWAADTFVDFDHGLNNAIKKLREALADDAEKPRFIETLSKRGYRFIGRAERLGNEARTLAPPAAAVTRNSIVVLPFINMSADAENEFFADGITEEIINALAQIKELHVVARSSTFLFKGKHIDPRVVGKQLDVRTVLEGSVRRADNRLRITVQLVNAADGYHLWSERYDREMKHVFEIQDEIARSIAERLKVTLEGGGQEPLVKAKTKSLEAYQLYLKGRALLYQRGSAIRLALKCFEEAVALDREYSLAWAGIADVYTLLGCHGFMHPETSRPRWQEAANRAVAADALLAEAHSALAFGSLMYDWNKTEAKREFLCALQSNSRYIQARDWYALFYLQGAAGRLADGVEHAKMALECDPFSGYANAILGLAFAVAGAYTEAVESSQRAVELASESFVVRWCQQTVFYSTGRYDDAVVAAQGVLEMSGRHPWAMAVLALTLADCKKLGEAEAVYAELVARARREYVPPSTLALAASAAERREEALHHAREAMSIRDPFRPIFTSYWPFSTRLRADSRVEQMLKEAGFD